MSLAAFNVTVPLDGAVVLPPEFAGQEIRIVIETPSETEAEEERIRSHKKKMDRFWRSISSIADRVQARNKRLGLAEPTEEEVMALVKECRREEGEAMRQAQQETALCTD